MRTIFDVEKEIEKLYKEKIEFIRKFKYSFYVYENMIGHVFDLGGGSQPGFFERDETKTVYVVNNVSDWGDDTVIYTDDFIFGIKYITDKKCLIDLEIDKIYSEMIFELFSEHYEKIIEYKEKVIDLISTFDGDNINILYQIIKGLKDE